MVLVHRPQTNDLCWSESEIRNRQSKIRIEGGLPVPMKCGKVEFSMQKYLVTFFGGNAALRYSNLGQADAEAREKHLAAWKAWVAALARTGCLENGHPLASKGVRVTAAGAEEHQFPESSAGGFMVLKADTLEKAAEMVRSAPIIKNGGHILVQPCGEI
jgi:hypothetical protein